MKIKPN